MNTLSDTTGIQNPIFKILQSQKNFQSNFQNPNQINPNSLIPAQNQIGNNGMNQIQGQVNVNNPQQQPIINPGINQGLGQNNNFIGQMGFGNNNQIIPQQNGVNNPMGMVNQINPNIPQQQPINQINPQFLGNNGMINNNSFQQMILQQQMVQQQINAAQEANKKAQINQILNNMIQGTGNNSPVNQSSQQGFSVIFRVGGNAGQGFNSIIIQCLPNEKVSEMIEKYRARSGDWDPTKTFTFNAKRLAPSLTLAEAGISNNANIFVSSIQDIIGAM